MSRGFEDDILRPAVIAALSQIPYWTGHVAPVEVLHQSGRRRSQAELGAGCPDILGSVRARVVTDRVITTIAVWVCLELKAPRRHVGWICAICCAPWVDCPCGSAGRKIELPAPVQEGRVRPEQEQLHAAWRSQGRWVFVVRSPSEAVAAVESVARALRGAGLEVG